MNTRTTVVTIAILLVAGWSAVGSPRQDPPQADARIATLIASLETKTWDKAVEALVAIGEPAVGPLIAALRSGAGYAGPRAAFALARIGTPPALDAVFEAVASPSPPVRETAVAALGFVRSERSVSTLLAVARVEGGQTQRAALASLAAIGDSRAVGVIAGAFGSPDWRTRDEAARALGKIGSSAGVGPLVTALGDENTAVRQSAREALVDCGDLAIAGVAGALNSPAPDVQRQSAWVLGHIEDPRAIAPLLGALEHRDAMVRVESSVGLARLGTGARTDLVVDGAARVLGNPRAVGREDAAWVLGEVKSRKGIAPLVAALDDPQAGWMAATSLGVLAAPEAAARLAGALASPSTRTRRAAAWALAKLKAEPVPAIHRALVDPDDEVRYWAAEALRSAGTVEAMRALSSAKTTRWNRDADRCAPDRSSAMIASGAVAFDGRRHALYPAVLDSRPDVPSPLTTADGTELAVAVTGTGRYAIYPVTLHREDRQCEADGDDFPTLARSGLHAEIELDRARTITGRSVSEITSLARPGRVSDAGFLGAAEDIVSVLKADNRIVAALGLTHSDLARPLLQVWNMMQLDLASGRWSRADQQWQTVTALFSRGHAVKLAAGDTKGPRESVFADGIEGAYWIEAGRDLDDSEREFLRLRYARLTPPQWDAFVRSLTRIRTGEVEAHYVMWYGFYDGLTPSRADPVAIALVFGLRTLAEIEAAFPGRLYELMMTRFAR